MENENEFTSEQKINLLEALKKMNELASNETIDFKRLQEVATYMASDCLEPLNLESTTEKEETVVEAEKEEEEKKASFVPKEETVEEKRRIR